MPKLPLALCFASFLLSACGTSRPLAMPNGWTRVPVNSRAAIDEYTATAARENASAKEEAQQRQQAALSSELAQLKALMAELVPGESQSDTRAPVPVGAKGKKAALATPKASVPPYRSTETVVQHGRSVMFEVAQRPGESRFAPSPAFQNALLNAARKASRIDIQGARGGVKTDPGGGGIAKLRADNVRKYLLANGIDIGRINTPDHEAGSLHAGGSASQAVTTNRGVSIDVIATGTTGSEANGPTTSGGLP